MNKTPSTPSSLPLASRAVPRAAPIGRPGGTAVSWLSSSLGPLPLLPGGISPSHVPFAPGAHFVQKPTVEPSENLPPPTWLAPTSHPPHLPKALVPASLCQCPGSHLAPAPGLPARTCSSLHGPCSPCQLGEQEPRPAAVALAGFIYGCPAPSER